MHHRRLVLPVFVLATLVLVMATAAPVLAGGRPFTTTLSGLNEVPSGDPDATGTATVWVNPGTGTVCAAVAAQLHSHATPSRIEACKVYAQRCDCRK